MIVSPVTLGLDPLEGSFDHTAHYYFRADRGLALPPKCSLPDAGPSGSEDLNASMSEVSTLDAEYDSEPYGSTEPSSDDEDYDPTSDHNLSDFEVWRIPVPCTCWAGYACSDTAASQGKGFSF